MAHVAQEPTPSPGRVFARSMRNLALRDALTALMTAWRLAFEPSGPVRTRSRVSAAALFLSVIVFLGVGGSLLTGSALVLFGTDDQPPQLVPGASPTEAIAPTPSPSALPLVATPRPEATEPSPSPRPRTDEADEPGNTDQKAGQKRATPEPKERERDRKEKRETPEPTERDRDEEDHDERDDD